MRVMFVLPRLVVGGVERVTLNLISMLKADGVECMLALRSCHGGLLEEARTLTAVYELAHDGMTHFLPRLVGLIRKWRPSHLVTAFTDIGLLSLVACRIAGTDTVLIHGVHNTHDRITKLPGYRGLIRFLLDAIAARVLYHLADAIVTVSLGLEDEVKRISPVASRRVHTIYNPVISSALWDKLAHRMSCHDGDHKRILALGRLTTQKGFDILIRAMTRMKSTKSWHLDIFGEGPLYETLQSLIRELGMEARINLRGHTHSAIEELCKSDAFVLPSRHEGLPTALIEALACGVQVIASDCPHGPREILQGGRLGTLVPVEDEEALASALSRTLRGSVRFDPAALRARARDFTIEASYHEWRSLLDSVQH